MTFIDSSRLTFRLFIALTLAHITQTTGHPATRHLHNGDYGTHMTALITAAMHTEGPILELGCGDYSTTILHAICSGTNRTLISAESDVPWLSLFIDLTCPWHHFICVPESYDENLATSHLWDSIDPEEHYGMVFIDHAPAERRIEDIKRLRDKTDVFVVHDTEDPRYNYESILPSFRYIYVDTRYALTTTVVSDTIDVSTFFNDNDTKHSTPCKSSKNYGRAEGIFTNIYLQNTWRSGETRSGRGSEISITRRIRPQISTLLKTFNITSIADAGCGDFNWMRLMDLGSCEYIGLDIVKPLIDQNERFYTTTTRHFAHHNIIEEPIHTVDLILCRDVFAHLTYAEIMKTIKNFKASGSKYLLVTTNVRITENQNASQTGDWRLLNLEKAPFNFPKPLSLIEEDVPFACEQGKHLGLWKLADIDIE